MPRASPFAVSFPFLPGAFFSLVIRCPLRLIAEGAYQGYHTPLRVTFWRPGFAPARFS
ncbi:hypothetical protein BN137_1574 [Cronobacter condimenti 1330]|uniref:Uncharacterized protein n=1 Tax=Cronobacter condimenti 1330 TaxID=1073999 RepID=K8A8Y5_9ENTR|nr:hypothetical protein BN137_1574 [Cronobacter condimenti 1330]